MNRQIIFLSDLYGSAKKHYFDLYLADFQKDYRCLFLDSCVLGEIHCSPFDKEKVHRQFVEGGIERAAKVLLDYRKEDSIVVGFSVGGVIGWKSLVMSSSPNPLFALSSTRLRYEMDRPKGRISLLFGQNDPFKPSKEWSEVLGGSADCIPDENHEVYKKQTGLRWLREQIDLL